MQTQGLCSYAIEKNIQHGTVLECEAWVRTGFSSTNSQIALKNKIRPTYKEVTH